MRGHQATPTAQLNVDAWLKHHVRFKNYLTRRLGDKEAAEDILQSSAMKAMLRSDAPGKEEDFVPWFYTVLRHASVDYFRREGVRRASMPQWIKEQAEDALPSASEHQALCRCLMPLLATLKSDQAKILREVDMQGHAPEKLADRLGITPNHLRVRLFRARQGLKAKLKTTCGSCSEHHCKNCDCRL